MTEVYWLEQSEADVPADDEWLSASEARRLESLRFPKRRADWRLGRWTAKRALALLIYDGGDPAALKDIEIIAAASGAPEVLLFGKPAACTISLSHRGGVAACATAREDIEIGCDLEIVEPRSEQFIADYLTAQEQAFIAQAEPSRRAFAATLIWSAKESVLKAIRTGLREDTRSVLIGGIEWAGAGSDSAGAWHSMRAHTVHGQEFQAWWRESGGLIRTFAGPAGTRAPVLLPAQKLTFSPN